MISQFYAVTDSIYNALTELGLQVDTITYYAFVPMLVFYTFTTVWLGRKVRDISAQHLEIILFGFSFGVCLSLLVSYSFSVDAFMEVNRELLDPWQRAIYWFFQQSTNAFDEFELIGAIFFLTVMPQVIAYFLSGILFGCASIPHTVSLATRALAWFLCKFFAVAAGVFSGLLIYEALHRLRGTPGSYSAIVLSLAMGNLLLSFLVALFIDKWSELIAEVRRKYAIFDIIDQRLNRER